MGPKKRIAIYQGQYYDPEIDLSYNRYRYFDSKTGSFVSQDPLGLAAGENVYGYAPNVWGWIDPLGLSCKQALPEFTNYQDFNNVFGFKPRRYGREMWDEYLHSPDKFAGRKRVQDTLKSEGYWRYTPAERVENAYRDVNHAYALTHGDSKTAKVIQFGTQFIEGLAAPPGSPDVYDTFAGKMGSLVSSIVSRFLPL